MAIKAEFIYAIPGSLKADIRSLVTVLIMYPHLLFIRQCSSETLSEARSMFKTVSGSIG